MNEQNKASCDVILRSLSDYVDKTLSAELCQMIESHLAECPDCQVVVDTLQRTVYLYHRTAAEITVPDDVRQRLFRRLDLSDFLKK